MITILTYIILRLFVSKKNYYLEGDEVRHLACAKNFYKLWNKSFYDMHPPLYSWLIKYFRSGVIVSLLCSFGLYYVSALLFSALGLPLLQRTMALTLMTFNYTLIYYSNRIFRYQLIALLGTATIYFLVTHQWIAAGLTWGLLGLTCTYAGLRMFWAWLLGCNLITLLLYFVIFGSWLIEKAKVYKAHKYYPSGVEGKIEQVNPFTFRQLLSPYYFKWSYLKENNRQLIYDFKNWHKKIGGVFGLYKPLGFMVPIALFFTVKGALHSPLWVSALVFCLLYPSLLKRFNPRNSIITIPLLSYLIAKGIPHINLVWLYIASGCVVAGFLAKNRVLCFTHTNMRAMATSAYLSYLEGDGIMADGPIAYFLAYRTNKRVVIIPHERGSDIEQMFLSIKEFDLNYAVISDAYKLVYKPGTYPALVFIQENFKLLTTIWEDGNVYSIYEIPEAYKVDRTACAKNQSRLYWARQTCYN